MSLPRIGRAICIVASSCIGITLRAQLTSRCLDISRNSSKNTSIKYQPNHNIAHTRPHRNNMEPNHKPRSQSTSLPRVIQQRNKRYSTNSLKHLVLCKSGRHHSPHGAQLNRKRTNARPHEHDCQSQTIVGLSCHTSGRDHSVPSIGHGVKHPFGRILSIRIKRT